MKYLVLTTALMFTACALHSASRLDAISTASRLVLNQQALPVDTVGVSPTLISSLSAGSIFRTNGLGCTLLCYTPSLTLLGTVAPPTVSAQILQASDVSVSGTKAYVAYNMAGPLQLGGVDVIDFSVPNTPTLASSTTYADSDINKLFVDAANAKLYLAGNTSSGATGAVLYRLGLNTSGLPTAALETKVLRSAANPTLPAFAATSVVQAGSFVYALTGNNGGLSILNLADLSDAAFTAIPDARDVSIGPTNKALVVSGQTSLANAGVNLFNAATGAALSDPAATTFSGATIDQGKASVYAGNSAYIATGGQGGAKLVCYNGTSIGSMPIPTVAGQASSDVAANAVAYGNGIIYVAQGAAGVYMYAVGNSATNLNGCLGYTLNYVGSFALAGRASANNVYYTNGDLIVATGYGGFQIIQVTQGVVTGLLGAVL